MVQRDQTVHPSADPAEGGAQNKQLDDVAPAATNDTSTANFGTSTTAGRYFLVKPLAAGTEAAPAYAQNFGWNILVADMNRDVSTKDTRIPAGTWSFQCQLVGGGATAPAARVQARVHRRSAAGTLTGLFTTESADVSPPALSAAYSVNWTSPAQPEYRLDTGETLHVEYWIRSTGAALLGNSIAFRVGGGTGATVPQITVPVGFTDLTYTAAPASTTALTPAPRKAISIRRTAASAVAATIGRRTSLIRQAVATVTPVLARRLSLKRALAAATTALGTRRNRISMRRAATTTVAPVGARRLVLRRAAATLTTVIPAAQRRLALRRAVAASSAVLAGFARKLISRRHYTATAQWIGKVWLKVETRLLPPSEGGPPRVVTFVIRLAALLTGSPALTLRRARASELGAAATHASATCSLRVIRAGGHTTRLAAPVDTVPTVTLRLARSSRRFAVTAQAVPTCSLRFASATGGAPGAGHGVVHTTALAGATPTLTLRRARSSAQSRITTAVLATCSFRLSRAIHVGEVAYALEARVVEAPLLATVDSVGASSVVGADATTIYAVVEER